MDSIYKYDGTPLNIGSNAPQFKLRLSSMGRISDDIDSTFADGSEFDLCAFRSRLVSGSNPITIGWLYQRSPVNQNGCELWYSPNQLDKPKLLTTMTGIKPNDSFRSFVVSPTHGDVITLKMDNRNAPVVYDASSDTTTTISGLQMNPIGWLGSSGCDFGLDGQGNEFFMFGEYTGMGHSTYENVHVWKVTYPYSEPSNWNVVLTLARSPSYMGSDDTKVWHVHTVQYDPYGNVWYATTGDSDAETKWWYSTDYGATWTKLLTGTEWTSQVARVLNFAFTKDYIWWANDYGTNHSVNRVARAKSGVADKSTHEIVAELNKSQSTYATALLTYPRGILMLDRVDTAFASSTNKLTVQFYSFDDGKVHDLRTFTRMTNSPNNFFGFRCKVYTIRQSPYDTRIGVGWDNGAPNWIDMEGNSGNALWTVFLDIV